MPRTKSKILKINSGCRIQKEAPGRHNANPGTREPTGSRRTPAWYLDTGRREG
jgi:hypothetical protein